MRRWLTILGIVIGTLLIWFFAHVSLNGSSWQAFDRVTVGQRLDREMLSTHGYETSVVSLDAPGLPHGYFRRQFDDYSALRPVVASRLFGYKFHLLVDEDGVVRAKFPTFE